MINPLDYLKSAASWLGSWLPEAFRPDSSTPGGMADTESTMSSFTSEEEKQTLWSWLKSFFVRTESKSENNDELKMQISKLIKSETLFAIKTMYKTLLRNIEIGNFTNDHIREQIVSIQKEKAEMQESPKPVKPRDFFSENRSTIALFTDNSQLPARAFNTPLFQLLQSSTKNRQFIQPALLISNDHKEMIFTCRDIQPGAVLPKLPKGFHVEHIENGYRFTFVEE